MNFREILFSDRNLFDNFEYVSSDYIFSYLYMFCELYRLQIYQDDKSVIIRSGNQKPVFYMPLGDMEHGIELVLEHCRANKLKPVFAKIPADCLPYFEKYKFKIKEDRNSFDYIFRNSDLAGYQGKEFGKQRNNLSNYLRTFSPEYTTDISRHIDECRAFTRQYYTKIDVVNPTLRILDKIEDLDLEGGIVWNQGKIQAFCVCEYITDDTALSHVELTDNSHRGIHTYMINEMSKRMKVEFINKEDDVGLMGLRRFKESYNPCFMLKKYTATVE